MNRLTPASVGSVAAFVVIVVAVIAASVMGVRCAYRGDARQNQITWRYIIALAIWLGGLSTIVAFDVAAALPLQGLPFLIGSILLVSLATGFSPLGGRLAANVSLGALVGFQVFRLPLELVLHRWAELGTIPREMTWTGQNWDIVTGIVCLVAAPFAGRNRAVAWFANIVGGVLLLNVLRVVVMTSPLPFAWDVQPKLLLALHLPYMLIAPVCVGGALIGHIVLTRALLLRNS